MIELTKNNSKLYLTGQFEPSQALALEAQLIRYIQDGPVEIVVDVSAVGRSSSGLLALMLSSIRMARAQGKSIYFTPPAPELMGLIALSNLERIIPVQAQDESQS